MHLCGGKGREDIGTKSNGPKEGTSSKEDEK